MKRVFFLFCCWNSALNEWVFPINQICIRLNFMILFGLQKHCVIICLNFRLFEKSKSNYFIQILLFLYYFLHSNDWLKKTYSIIIYSRFAYSLKQWKFPSFLFENLHSSNSLSKKNYWMHTQRERVYEKFIGIQNFCFFFASFVWFFVFLNEFWQFLFLIFYSNSKLNGKIKQIEIVECVCIFYNHHRYQNSKESITFNNCKTARAMIMTING